jgi:hypothetical protein
VVLILDPLQFQIVLALLCMVIFVITYFIRKKYENYKELIYDSFMDGISLYSGVIIILFSVGKVFNIEYLAKIDNLVLYFFLFFAGFIIIGGCLDKIKGGKK